MSEEGKYLEKEEEVEQMEGAEAHGGADVLFQALAAAAEPAVWALGMDGQAEGKAGAEAIGAKCARVPAAVTAGAERGRRLGNQTERTGWEDQVSWGLAGPGEGLADVG